MINPLDERSHDLARWLKTHVKHYSTPQVLRLSRFEIDAEELDGTFKITLDEDRLRDEFSYSIEGNGLPNLLLPMFISPLGVPASFPAVVLTRETESAIETALGHIIPKLRPLGLYKATGKIIDTSTPLDERVLEPEKLRKLFQISGSKKYQLNIHVSSGVVLPE